MNEVNSVDVVIFAQRSVKMYPSMNKTKMLINKCDTKMSVKWLIIVVLMNGARCLANGESIREQIPLVRLPSNTLLKYTAYKDVSILHFDVPADTRTAYFNFKAYEESKSAFCEYPVSINHTIQITIFIFNVCIV